MANPLIDGFLIDSYADGETGWGATMNQNLARLGWLVARGVLTLGGNTPPGAPAANDRHVVGTAPVGAWATQGNKFARWNGTAWEFLTPVENTEVLSFTNGGIYRFTSGAWILLPVATHASTHLPAGTDPLLFGTVAGIHGVGTLAGRPAAGAANNGLLYFATDVATGGRLFRSDGTAWVPISPSASGNVQQTISSVLASAASVSTTTYANLLSLPITVLAGSKLTVWISLSARNTGGINASVRGRLRVDGAVSDATVAGFGFANTFPILNASQQCSLAAQVTGLAPGAHTLFFDWSVGAAAQTVNCDPSTNQNTDQASIVAQECYF